MLVHSALSAEPVSVVEWPSVGFVAAVTELRLVFGQPNLKTSREMTNGNSKKCFCTTVLWNSKYIANLLGCFHSAKRTQ